MRVPVFFALLDEWAGVLYDNRMEKYTGEELSQALRAVDSIILKCERAHEKFPEGNAHHTLLRNRLKAMYISKSLMEEALFRAQSGR